MNATTTNYLPSRVVFDVTEARLYSEHLTELLFAGWEPFAALPAPPDNPVVGERVLLRIAKTVPVDPTRQERRG